MSEDNRFPKRIRESSDFHTELEKNLKIIDKINGLFNDQGTCPIMDCICKSNKRN